MPEAGPNSIIYSPVAVSPDAIIDAGASEKSESAPSFVIPIPYAG